MKAHYTHIVLCLAVCAILSVAAWSQGPVSRVDMTASTTVS
jgi:hypothetical protein